jgi:hypothetical protein
MTDNAHYNVLLDTIYALAWRFGIISGSFSILAVLLTSIWPVIGFINFGLGAMSGLTTIVLAAWYINETKALPCPSLDDELSAAGYDPEIIAETKKEMKKIFGMAG